MRDISTATLEKSFKNPEFQAKWKVKDIMKCLFAVSEGLLFLHNHLICHGNLCPSNIIIDEAKQSYLVDFGLYPIKKLYMTNDEIFNKEYKDPNTNESNISFSNDVYSYGILIIQFHLVFSGLQEDGSIQKFLSNKDERKYDIFPKIFKEMIPRCLLLKKEERLTFQGIREMYENESYEIENIHQHVSNIYNKFIKTFYLETLCNQNDSNAMNKLGNMYFKGKLKDRNNENAKIYFKKAADLGNSEGENKYGVILMKEGKKENNEDKQKIAASYFEKSANKRNIHGMCNYGIALENGYGVERDMKKAEEYLKKSADLGYSHACVKYALFLFRNKEDVGSRNAGLEYMKKAMNEGSGEAYYEYGILLREGKFVDKDEELSTEYFKVGADIGHEKSILEYAACNMYGIGTQVNLNEAIKYYEIGSEKGNKKAINKLKELLKGPTSPMKTTKAANTETKTANTETKTAEQNEEKQAKANKKDETISNNNKSENNKETTKTDVPSIINELTPNQQSVPNVSNDQPSKQERNEKPEQSSPKRDSIQNQSQLQPEVQIISPVDQTTHQERPNVEDESEEVIEENGFFSQDTSPEALYEIFKNFRNQYYGLRESENDDKMKYQLFKFEKQFINTKDPRIIYKYAKLYKYDVNNEESQKKSMEYFKKSAENGYAKAQSYYGLCLLKGEGVEKDEKEGIEMLKSSCIQGDVNGMYELGLALYQGIGIEKDEDFGLVYLKEAAEHGKSEAQMYYGLWCLDPVVGHQYIEEAANDSKCTKAKFYLAKDFMEGRGVERNLHKAIEIFIDIYEKERDHETLLYLIRCLKETDYGLAIYYMKIFSDLTDKELEKEIKEMQFEYGLELFKGEHTEVNIEESFKYIKKSGFMSRIRSEHPEIYSVMPHDFTPIEKGLERFLIRRGFIDPDEQKMIDNARNGDIGATVKAAKEIENTGDYKTSNFLYEIAADSNDAESSFILGEYYSLGLHGLKKNESKTQLYKSRAEHLGYYETLKNKLRQGTADHEHIENNEKEQNSNSQTTDSQISESQEIEQNFMKEINDVNMSVEDLISRGDYYAQTQPELALKYFEEVIRRGDDRGYQKCAEQFTSFDKKLEYYEKAIDKKVSGAFSTWRKRIFKYIQNKKDENTLHDIAAHFLKYDDYSDAARIYYKAKNEEKYKYYYSKAKENLDNIQDGQQQLFFSYLCEKQNDIDIAIEMATKALQNGETKAKDKLESLKAKKEKQQKPISATITADKNHHLLSPAAPMKKSSSLSDIRDHERQPINPASNEEKETEALKDEKSKIIKNSNNKDEEQQQKPPANGNQQINDEKYDILRGKIQQLMQSNTGFTQEEIQLLLSGLTQFKSTVEANQDKQDLPQVSNDASYTDKMQDMQDNEVNQVSKVISSNQQIPNPGEKNANQFDNSFKEKLQSNSAQINKENAVKQPNTSQQMCSTNKTSETSKQLADSSSLRHFLDAVSQAKQPTSLQNQININSKLPQSNPFTELSSKKKETNNFETQKTVFNQFVTMPVSEPIKNQPQTKPFTETDNKKQEASNSENIKSVYNPHVKQPVSEPIKNQQQSSPSKVMTNENTEASNLEKPKDVFNHNVKFPTSQTTEVHNTEPKPAMPSISRDQQNNSSTLKKEIPLNLLNKLPKTLPIMSQKEASPTLKVGPNAKPANQLHKAQQASIIKDKDEKNLVQKQATADLNKSGSLSDADAESFLEQGITFFSGKHNMAQDYNKAFDFFKRASDLGSPKADFYLGSFYQNGYGNVTKNSIYSAIYFRRSAEKNDPDGQNGYANCLKNGFGVKKNIDKALQMYKLAADAGNNEAAFNYGRELYLKSSDELEVQRSIPYLRKGAEVMIPDALYLYSMAIKKYDPKESKLCLEMSIQRGSKMAEKAKQQDF
ncbi:hypothetical protein M9Y10_025163 [Tritrichomonas musculus]|uniref:Protein kinase domain-containing protein n=1 Tax=Tritrichomonas musculus TaxID=1915356 RepID=A0ABR2HCK5_9EUKA